MLEAAARRMDLTARNSRRTGSTTRSWSCWHVPSMGVANGLPCTLHLERFIGYIVV